MNCTTVTVVIAMLVMVMFVHSIENEDPCFENPCNNGGTCTVIESGFSCMCSSGFTGTLCDVEQCPKPRTMKCDDGVLTTGDNLSCMEGYTRIVYATSMCLNQPIEDTMCIPGDINVATLRFYGSSKYLFVRTFTNVHDAKNSCSRVCGSLVEINNEEENTFLATTAEELQISSLTIGLEHNGEEFVWSSGNTTDAYSNWDSAENFESTCVYLVSGNTKWNTLDCIGLSQSVCEISSNGFNMMRRSPRIIKLSRKARESQNDKEKPKRLQNGTEENSKPLQNDKENPKRLQNDKES
ncbi:unnamed protein product [Mytilus coruscus]|uniref:C-type lectin domain-containing protein n=1 Tax=Mytilus coruscus TaxID=42192 RepID=A0A6J8CTI4_MYTCO|nr:unnamed protein product [Mytilus coruscus]